jgi:polar amino acid transport system substrate-binding protein
MRSKAKSRHFGIFSIAVFLLAVMLAAGNVFGAELELVKPGTLIVAFNGDMPGTSLQNGKLIGLDGELMQWVAEQLGLKVEPALMEWSAEIASVESKRVDIMHGMMGWSAPRTKVLLMSDPIYYMPPGLTQKKEQSWSTLKDLEGKRVGTITGFAWIDEMKRIPGLTLSLYDTSDAAIRDLLAGRVEVLMADGPLVQYAIMKNPDWNIHQVALNDPKPDFPILTTVLNAVFAVNKDSANLLKAVNEKITEAWKTCKNLEIGKKYGMDDVNFWFKPPSQNYRVGVDRPEGWTFHALAQDCK